MHTHAGRWAGRFIEWHRSHFGSRYISDSSYPCRFCFVDLFRSGVNCSIKFFELFSYCFTCLCFLPHHLAWRSLQIVRLSVLICAINKQHVCATTPFCNQRVRTTKSHVRSGRHHTASLYRSQLFSKRPALPHQPNLYLEPKWLRCHLINGPLTRVS